MNEIERLDQQMRAIADCRTELVMAIKAREEARANMLIWQQRATHYQQEVDAIQARLSTMLRTEAPQPAATATPMAPDPTTPLFNWVPRITEPTIVPTAAAEAPVVAVVPTPQTTATSPTPVPTVIVRSQLSRENEARVKTFSCSMKPHARCALMRELVARCIHELVTNRIRSQRQDILHLLLAYGIEGGRTDLGDLKKMVDRALKDLLLNSSLRAVDVPTAKRNDFAYQLRMPLERFLAMPSGNRAAVAARVETNALVRSGAQPALNKLVLDYLDAKPRHCKDIAAVIAKSGRYQTTGDLEKHVDNELRALSKKRGSKYVYKNKMCQLVGTPATRSMAGTIDPARAPMHKVSAKSARKAARKAAVKATAGKTRA